MTSKSSFFNLMRENLKVDTAAVLMTTILFFLNFPIVAAIQVQKVSKHLKNSMGYGMEDAMESLTYYIGGENRGTMFLTVMIASVMGISQFGYLYHRNRVDFYHSLPIRREKQFSVRFINGFLIYVIPYLVFCLIGISVISAFGYGQMAVLKAAFLGFMLNTICYLMCFSTAILAVCLTGNLFTGICGIVTFQGYGILLAEFLSAVMNRYSATYMEEYERLSESYRYFSPLGAYMRLLRVMNGQESGSKVFWLFGCLTAGLLITFAALWVYVHRKSESAGKSLAFDKAKGIIKVFVMSLILGCGSLFFSSISYNAKQVWLVVGFAVTFILAQIVIQLIFELDIASVKQGIKSAVVSAVLVITVFLGFYFAGQYYDAYQIDWTHMESASVNFGEQIYGGYNNSYDIEKGRYVDLEEQIFEHMKITDRELMKSYTKECIESHKKKGKGQKFPVTIKYVLNNGRKVYRQYQVETAVIKKYMLKFLDNAEFRRGINYIFSINPEDIGQLKYYDGWSDYKIEELGMNHREIVNLIKTYREEYLNATVEELNEHAPVMNFVPCVKGAKIYEEWEVTTVYVYPSFTKTIALLKDEGVEIINMDEIEITEAVISWWDGKEDITMEEPVEVTYTEPERLQELKDFLCFGEYGFYTAFDSDYKIKSEYTATLEIKDKQRGITQKRAMFTKEVPKWLLEDLKASEIQQEIGE